MRVNIVCTDTGWVYSRFIEKFKQYSQHEILVNETNPDNYDAVHYLPYYEAVKTRTPSTAWFSHMEERPDLNKKFVEAARAVDMSISHSKKYADMLRDTYHLRTVAAVITGVDTDMFKLRPSQRSSASPKVIVGYVGRDYTSSNRKNPELLKRIAAMPIVEFRCTGGDMSLEDIPAFYADLDLVISPATIEGGPMAVQESLSCGVPILTMSGVGVADEFGKGVLRAENDADFIRQIKLMHSSKTHLNYWRHTGNMKNMRHQVLEQTWAKFVAGHDRVWSQITKESWKTSRG